MPLFLFTDIESSTRLWEKYPEGMQSALKRHDTVLAEQLEIGKGRIIKHTGDGIFAVFETYENALACVLAVQRELAGSDWGEVGELRIRMALHHGDATLRGDDYFGPDVNRAARLMSAGWGGQILVSREALDAAPLPAGAEARDLGMHLLKDLRAPTQIFLLNHPDLPQRDYPAPRSLSARPNNLPPQSTPFVGRARELREIHKLMDGEGRLLTLLGPGGMGKTRLALQVAAERIENYYHGVYFVPMAPLENADRMIYAIADSLRFTFYNNDEPRVQLENYLREKEILIVLDNFEHIMNGADLAGEILDAAPGVRILTTSREKLKLRHERIFAVAGMSFPDTQAPDLDDDTYSSVRLFTEAALRVQPDFDTESQREHIFTICELVGGMPLAIELAGAWCGTLECKEIVEELRRGPDFLETEMRDVPDRHRSLRAVFDYSWNLLNAEEQAALARLTIFRGDFTRAAAQGALDVSLSVLTNLLNKSLLQKTEDGRFAVHGMLARFAGEKLAPEDADRRRESHSAYFSAFMREKQNRMWRLPSDPEVLEEVRPELENIRGGIMEAAAHGRWEHVSGYARSLSGAFEGLDRQREGEEITRLVLKELEKFPAEDESSRLLLAFMTILRAWLGLRFGGLEEKRKAIVRARELVEPYGAVEEHVLLDGINSYIEYISGNYEAALTIGEKAREMAFHLDLPWAKSFTQAHLAYIYFIQGNYEKAESYALSALEYTREQGVVVGSGYSLNNLAEIEKARGNFLKAEEYLEASLACFEQAELKSGIGFVLNNLAEVDIKLGRQTQAWERYERSLAIAQDLGFDWGMGTALVGLGELALALDDHKEADLKFRESLNYFNRLGDSFRIARVRRKLGETALALGDGQAAEQSFREALQTALEAGIPAEMLSSVVHLARLSKPASEAGLRALAAALVHPALNGDTKQAAENLREDLEKTHGEELEALLKGANPPDLEKAARALLA